MIQDVRRKRLLGVVVAAGKMDRTVTVLVERTLLHPKTRKQIRRTKRYLVHDERNEARAGERVVIEETRPRSKRKHFRIFSRQPRP